MLEKIGQLLIIGIEGKDLTEKEADFIVRNDIGGVILFSRNIESPQQVFELNQKIQKLSKKTHSHAPFFIGIDPVDRFGHSFIESRISLDINLIGHNLGAMERRR